MSNLIPTRSRNLVSKRDGGCCVRCGMLAAHWHHRRSRRVNDAHTHCPCVGVLLCRTCHEWAHKYPEGAVEVGLGVTQFCSEPTRHRVRTLDGWAQMLCDGSVQTFTERNSSCPACP